MNAKQVKEDSLESDQIETASKTIAVLQLTRIGDILQTLHVFQELKEQRPEIKLVFIGREVFTKPIRFLLNQVFESVYMIDPFTFSKTSTPTLESFLDGQNKLIETISAQNINVLMNLSFSKSSAHLARLLKADHKLGLVTQDNGQDIATDKWSQYTHATVQSGPLNGFSLVDIYRLIAGVELKAPLASLSAHTKESKKIVIHPFSSHRKKNWRPEKWVEIVYQVLKSHEGHEVHIVGGKGDQADAQKICSNPLLKNQSRRLFNHAGEQDVEFVWNLICDSALFVGHDSMVGHLASLARTQSLTLSLGTVRPFETTPYGANNYAIAPRTKCFPCYPSDSCELLQCHADISYQLVTGCIDQLLNNGSIEFSALKEKMNSFHLASAEIYQTFATKANLLGMININGDSTPNLKHVYQGIGRLVWLFMLEEKEEALNYFALNEMTVNDIKQQKVGLESLFQLCEFGKKYCLYILEEIASETVSITKLKEYSQKIDEIDTLTNSLLAAYPTLKPIVTFLALQKSTLAGENLVQMSESAFITYDRGSVASQLFLDLLENNIKHSNFSTPTNLKDRQDAV